MELTLHPNATVQYYVYVNDIRCAVHRYPVMPGIFLPYCFNLNTSLSQSLTEIKNEWIYVSKKNKKKFHNTLLPYTL